MRALHLVVAFLLVGTTVGAAVPPASPSSTDAGVGSPGDATTGPAAVTGSSGVAQADRPPAPDGAVRMLDVPPNASTRSALDGAYVDLGPALRFGTAGASHRLETIQAVERVRSVPDAERGAQLRRELDRIRTRTDALRTEQRRAFEAYARNDTTSTALLIRLARVHRTARALEARLARLSRLANRSGVDLDRKRLERLRRELGLYTGPVRARAAAALAGESPPQRFYVAAGPRGVVLATLTENAYLREAYRDDLRRVNDRELSPRKTLEIVSQAYPRAWANRQRASVDGGRIGTGRIDYGNGTLSVAIGSGNGRVFADEHRQVLGPAATNVTAVNTRDGLRLTVNRTYAGGPMRVEIRDADGNRIDASVTVGPAGGESVTVGRTGSDGVLWTLTPGERYTVVAIRDQSVVFLTADPLATPRTNGTAGA